MTPDREAAIQAATEALVAALVAAVRDEAEATAAGPDRLRSVEQAAEALGLSRTATYSLIQSGQLRSVKVLRRRMIPDGAIRELIERQP